MSPESKPTLIVVGFINYAPVIIRTFQKHFGFGREISFFYFSWREAVTVLLLVKEL